MSYYSEAASRAGHQAYLWPNSHAIEFTAIGLAATAVVALMFFWPFSSDPKRRAVVIAEKLGIAAFLGFLISIVVIFLVFFGV